MTISLQSSQASRKPLPFALHYQKHLDFWCNKNPTLSQITYSLPDSCIDELDQVLDTPQCAYARWHSPSRLRQCHQFALQLKAELDQGAGAVLIDRFPIERYNDAQQQHAAGLFAACMGTLMPQNHAGTLFYDVKDTKPANPQAVRKSVTNHAQPYHTDGGWHRRPAKYIGLYCIRNASTGGGSVVTSLLSAFESLNRIDDKSLSKLCQEMPWDKQGEHSKNEDAIELNPIFEFENEQLIGRFYESYVRKGFALQNQQIDDETDQALITLRNVLSQQAAISFQLKAGQFQYVNNWTNLHARGAFVDGEHSAGGRHLIRIWNH